MFCKLRLLLIINVALSHYLYGQFLDYVSLGYNTVETVDKKGGSIFEYYFLNNKKFSKMAYNRRGYKTLYRDYDDSFRKAKDGSFYDGDIHYIYNVEKGKLVYAEFGFDGGYDDEYGIFYSEESKEKSKKITYTKDGLTVSFEDFVVKFYNIPENELYDKFMYLLTAGFENTINYYSNIGAMLDYDIPDIIKYSTKFELELFKYCIFAKYKYVFQLDFWKDFMNKYYYHYNSYPPRDIMFNSTERKLFQLIQEKLGEKEQIRYVVPPDGLNIRVGPDTNGEKILTIPKGGEVLIITTAPNIVVIDDIKSNWHYVKYNNRSGDRYGWIFGGYLSGKKQ